MTEATTILPSSPFLQIKSAGDHFKAIEERFRGQKSLTPSQWAIVRLDGHGFSKWVKRNYPTTRENNWNWQFERAMTEATKALAGIYRPQFIYTFSDEVTLVFSPERVMDLNGGRILKCCTLLAAAMTAQFAISSHVHSRKNEKDIATFDARAFSLPAVEDVAQNIGWRMCDARRNSVAHWARQYSSAKELAGMSSSQLIEHTENKGMSSQRPVLWRHLPLERRVGRMFQRCRTAKVFPEEAVIKLKATNLKFDLASMSKQTNKQTNEIEYVAYRSEYQPINSILENFCGKDPKSFFMVDMQTVNDLIVNIVAMPVMLPP